MTIAFNLNELQKIDLTIFKSREFLKRILFQINDTSSIDQCKTKLFKIEQELKKLILQRRSAELHENQIHDRVKSLDQKFTSVRNSKELTAVQDEMNTIKEQLSKCQDDLLEILLNLDQFELAKKTVSEELPQLEYSHSKLTSESQIKQHETEKELETLESSRVGIQRTLPANIFKLYEEIIHQTKSKAVSVFDKTQNICTECRLSQPQHIVHRLNRANEIIQCNSCKLILYMP